MKRFSLCLIALLTMLITVSCSAQNSDSQKLKIVTTIFPQYDFARAICADVEDEVELTMLLPPGSESHDYEPSLADLKLIGECDLFICVGGETDAWIESAVEAVGTDVNILRLTDFVELLCEEDDGIINSEHSHEHEEHEHDEHEIDEHVWTTPENAALITEAIGNELCRLRPNLANSFSSCCKEYTDALRELDREYLALTENASRKTLYFADRFPFRYLTEHCSLEYEAAFSGCSSGSEPSLATISQLINDIKASSTPIILTTEFASQNAPRFIAEECSCEIAILHSYHNVSKEDFDSGVTYLDLAQQNLSVLQRAIY